MCDSGQPEIPPRPSDKWGKFALLIRAIVDFLKGDTTTAIINLINVLNFIAIVATVVAVVFAYRTLEEQRVATAWGLIAAAKVEDIGNVGLIDALEGLLKRNQRFERVRLPGAHLAKIDLPESHLEGAYLTGASLGDANLQGAYLDGADLRNADLRGANLSNAHLRGTALDGSDLSGANLRGADLRGASLVGAHLFRADLRGATLRLANFTGANLSDALLQQSTLDGSRLDHAIMRGADLTGVDLGKAIMRKTDLRRSNLQGAIFGAAFVGKDVYFDNACRGASTPAGKWCGPPKEAQRYPSPSANKQVVYYLIPTLIDEWQTESQKVIERVFAELHYEVISVNADNDAELQNQQLADTVKLNPPIIILTAVDGHKIDRDTIASARRAGIRILLYDRPVSVETDFVSITDAEKTGEQAAESAVALLKEMVGGKGQILQILGDPADNWARSVQIGFERKLAETAPEVEVISKPAMNWDPNNARKVAGEQLTSNQDIKIVFAHAADLADAVVDVFKGMKKKPGDIKLISGNGAPVGLKNIREEGWQQVEIDEPVYAQVYALALFFDDIVKGNGPQLKARRCEVLGMDGELTQQQLGPTFTLTGKTITSQNVADPQFWGNLIPPKQPLPQPCP